MNERLREALRRKIAVHNRLVRLSSLASAIAVAGMWGAIYFISRWLAVFVSTIVKGLDAAIPQNFDRGFVVLFAVWLIGGFIARQRGWFRQVRSETSPGVVLLEVLLAPPRATFAVVQNMRSSVRFSEDDLIAATDFLVRVVRAGKMPATAVPVELPEEERRDRVVTGLQLLDLIYLRRKNEELWFAVSHPQRLVKFLES